MNPYARLLGIGVAAVLLAGCSSMAPQEAGYMLGSIAGGVLGSAPGAAAGALLGTAAGALIAKPIEHAREQRERDDLEQRLRTPSGGAPGELAQPTVPVPPPTENPTHGQIQTTFAQRIWIDEQVIDGRVIPGHFAERHPTSESWHASAGTSTHDLVADQQLQPPR